MRNRKATASVPIQTEPQSPAASEYVPKDNDMVARVYIEAKSASAFKMPLVEKPPARFDEIKTYGKENWPAQPKTALPDPFPDLDDKTRAYLKMWPYGDNIVINRKRIAELLRFYMEIRDLPLPESLQYKLKEQMEYTRSLVNLISIDESERNSEWKQILGEAWEPTYPYYKCKCVTKKRRAKASPGAKAINKKALNDDG